MEDRKRDSTDSSSVADVVWNELAEMFGAAFLDKFGAEPSKPWIEALADLRMDQARRALTKIRNAPLPYPGWLPSLPEFNAYVRGCAFSNSAGFQDGPPASRWVRYANGMFLSWMLREIRSGRRAPFGSRGHQRTIPDDELLERRTICRDLAQCFDMGEAEGDPAMTCARFDEFFRTHMDSIEVRNPVRERKAA